MRFNKMENPESKGNGVNPTLSRKIECFTPQDATKLERLDRQEKWIGFSGGICLLVVIIGGIPIAQLLRRTWLIPTLNAVWAVCLTISVAVVLLLTVIEIRQSAIKDRKHAFHVWDEKLLDSACGLAAECDTLLGYPHTRQERFEIHALHWQGFGLIRRIMDARTNEPTDGESIPGEPMKSPDAEAMLADLRRRLSELIAAAAKQ